MRATSMKTKFIICIGTGPDDMGDADFNSLEHVQSFTNEASARKEFASLIHGRTNMVVHLLRVELVACEQGTLQSPAPKRKAKR